MATTYTKSVDVVTRVYDTVTHAQHIDHSGELLTPALSNVADAQAAGSYTATPVGFDGVIEVLIGAADTNIPVPVPFDCKVIDAWAYKIGNGVALNTIKVIIGANTIMTLDASVADTLRVAGIGDNLSDTAKNVIAAGGALTVDPSTATCGATLFIRVKRTA